MGSWLVGTFDFDENPVVHLDLDFDLGLVKSRSTTWPLCANDSDYLKLQKDLETMESNKKNSLKSLTLHIRL